MSDDFGKYVRAAKAYIGRTSAVETACDVVEAGAVRRYAQAIGDEDPVYRDGPEARAAFGGPVAPPLFPTWMFRRSYGEPDPVEEHAADPDFDGVGAPAAQGLAPIAELAEFSVLNGGVSVEFIRYARHGESVTVQSRYADVSEKLASSGPMILIVIESEYRAGNGDLLLRVARTGIRRKMSAGRA